MSCAKSAVPNATLSENSLYVGINLQGILYGVQLGLYFKTIHVFLVRRRKPWQSDVLHALYSSVMLLLVTIRVATEGVYGQRMWLTERNYPGGPLAYAKAHASDKYMALGATVVVVLQQMTDALMIHRCRIVWDSFSVIVVPSILWLANLALGILVSWVAAPPLFKFFDGIFGKLGLAYTAVSVCLNVTLTCMILYRLVRYAKTAKKCHVKGERACPAIETLVEESMFPYTLCGIALLISHGVGSDITIVFSSVYTLMMCVSSQMLILRMAEGNAWERDRAEDPERSEGNGAVALVHLDTLRYETDK